MSVIDNRKYAGIMNLPHHVSPTRPQMPISDRAAQFSPFAALTGHQEVIRQMERDHVSEDMERETFYE